MVDDAEKRRAVRRFLEGLSPQNCEDSVEPSSAPVETVPPEMTSATSSK